MVIVLEEEDNDDDDDDVCHRPKITLLVMIIVTCDVVFVIYIYSNNADVCTIKLKMHVKLRKGKMKAVY